jgi:hypothetical protein
MNSINKIETEHNRYSNYQKEIYTEREQQGGVKNDEQEQNREILSYHKNKNKELEERIDALLKVNTELNEKMKNINQNSSNTLSI